MIYYSYERKFIHGDGWFCLFGAIIATFVAIYANVNAATMVFIFTMAIIAYIITICGFYYKWTWSSEINDTEIRWNGPNGRQSIRLDDISKVIFVECDIPKITIILRSGDKIRMGRHFLGKGKDVAQALKQAKPDVVFEK